MRPTLRATLEALAHRFTTDVLRAVSQALDEEVFARGSAAPAPKVRGRRRIDVGDVTARVMTALRGHPDGVRAEKLREELRIDKLTFGRSIRQLLADRHVRKTGKLRATKYFSKG